MTPTTTHAHTNGRVFLDAALELVWPTRCSGCERPGVLLCEECRSSLKRIAGAHACPRCGAPFGRLVCTECYSSEGREQHQFEACVCAMELDELSGRVIVLYKDSYERRLSSVLADYLLSALPAPWLGWADVLTWIPVDRKALRRRGFDHMEMIVQDLAERTGLRAQRLLDKQPTRDQRGLTRSERYENLQESFRLHDTAHALPQHILLIDDVLTTGATLDAASSRLKEGGAVEVRVACVARAW